MSMTREEAIEALRYRRNIINNVDIDWCDNEIAAIDVALSTLRPVSRERIEKAWRGGWIAVREAGCDPIGGYKCSRCEEEAVLDCNDEFVLDNFCPRCGAAMTDEAVEMVMERLEALKDGNDI